MQTTFITKVEAVTVDKSVFEICSYDPYECVHLTNESGETIQMIASAVHELIKSHCYYERDNGKETQFNYGVSDQAESVLRLYNGGVRALRNSLDGSNSLIESLKEDNKTLYCELVRVKKAKFITRLKWLFTGVKT